MHATPAPTISPRIHADRWRAKRGSEHAETFTGSVVSFPMTYPAADDLCSLAYEAAEIAKRTASTVFVDRGSPLGDDEIRAVDSSVTLDVTEALWRFLKDDPSYSGQAVTVDFSEMAVEEGRILVTFAAEAK